MAATERVRVNGRDYELRLSAAKDNDGEEVMLVEPVVGDDYVGFLVVRSDEDRVLAQGRFTHRASEDDMGAIADAYFAARRRRGG